jgi:hypothetical protein
VAAPEDGGDDEFGQRVLRGTASGPENALRRAVSLAVRAPSGHNTQPWLFHVEGRRLELRADRSRSLPVVDPDDRALEISCGAALAYLVLALEHLGYPPGVDVAQDGVDDLIAVVTVPEEATEAASRQDDVEAVLRRRTNRGAYSGKRVPPELVEAMQEQAADAGAWLEPIPLGRQRRQLTDLVVEGDRKQLSDRAFRRELATWVRRNDSPTADGIRGYGFGVSNLPSRLGPFVVRTFNRGRRQSEKDRDLVAAAPLVVVLGTDRDTRTDHVTAGLALGRVLMTAARAGVSAAFLNQPVEVPQLRSRLRDLVGRPGEPQLVLRLGYADDVRPQARRPVDEVLTS